MKASTIAAVEAAFAGASPPRLRSIFLHVTKACNLRCSYCYFSAAKPLRDELQTEEFERLWPEFVAVAPEKVVFTGGEPLLRPDLLELLMGLRAADVNHRILRCLNTNGHLVTKELARKLVGLADEVRVSLDALETRNDALRGKGNFNAAMRAIETYYSVGFEPKVLITVSKQSVPDLDELLQVLAAKGITRINLNGFRPIGRGYRRWDWRADPTQTREAVERARLRAGGRPITEPLEEATQSHCGVGRLLNIMPNGDVFPCHVLTAREFRCGNLRTDSLSSICQRQGMLSALEALDFRLLATEEGQVNELARRGTCLGNVYAKTKQLPIWRRHLPLVGEIN